MGISPISLALENYSLSVIVQHCLRNPAFGRLVELRLEAYRQTDGRHTTTAHTALVLRRLVEMNDDVEL